MHCAFSELSDWLIDLSEDAVATIPISGCTALASGTTKTTTNTKTNVYLLSMRGGGVGRKRSLQSVEFFGYIESTNKKGESCTLLNISSLDIEQG